VSKIIFEYDGSKPTLFERFNIRYVESGKKLAATMVFGDARKALVIFDYLELNVSYSFEVMQ
jgi:hypothetical protein